MGKGIHLKKRIIIILLTFLLGTGNVFAFDFSAVCPTGQTLYYKITDATNHYVAITYPGTVTYSQYSSYPNLSNTWTGYTKPTGIVSLPESVEYNGSAYTVTSIGNYTFYGCDLSGELIIPAYVTSIGSRAFNGCSGLTGELVFPANMMSIGESAFEGCSGFTGSLVIPNTVSYLGERAFMSCSGFNGTLTISNAITSIIGATFSGCGFTGPLVIPNSIVSIGNSAFQDCTGFTGTLTIPNSVTTIGNATFARCTGLTGSLVIPGSVTSIGYSAFEGCTGFTGSLAIPNSLTFIDTYVFGGCSGLTSVSIPDGMNSIKRGMFSNCTGLISVSIPNSVSSIEENAFSGCSGLVSVTVFSDTPPSFGNSAFYNVSSDIPVFVPGGAVQSYKNANGWSGFTNYHVNGNDTPVIFTDPIVFADTRVKSICVTNWDGNGDGELSYAEATAVTDISTVFRNKTYITSFDELQFFYRLSSIKDYAFSGCNKLTSIKFPNTVTSFGSSVFANCSKLTQIVMEEGNALFDSRDNCNAIIKTSDNQLIIGCKNTVIPNSVTSIGESAFDRCDGLNSIVIPNSVTSIGLFAFSNCTNLVAIEIPHSVVTMDKRAFFSCSGLSQIVVEEGNSVFDSRGNCNAIIRTSDNQLMIGCKNTTIPNSVTSIGDYAFQDCTGLTSVEIPNSVTSIGADAFFNCINIASMTIMAETPPNIFYYSYYVFYNVPKTIPVYVPCGSIEAYQAADKWNEFTNYRGIGSYSITVSATPLGSGSVTGGGYYCLGLPCTLTATEDIGGFAFASWTENGTVVSTDAIYTFTVTGARNLVANYTYQGSGGAIDGVFPVSENTYVNFAQGNLQYQPSTNRWRFAEHQWDLLVTPEDMNYLIEDYNIYVAVVDSLYTSTSSGWIDMFGWGTSGYNHGAYCYQPWSTSTNSSSYYAYGNAQYNLNDQTGMADWGYNAIINGGNEENLWRTLTKSEWQYLMDHCTNGWSTVAGVPGRVIRPYGVSTPIVSSYTVEQWEAEQDAGSIFLPAAGVRTTELSVGGIFYQTPVWGVGTSGYYWSSTIYYSDGAFCFSLSPSQVKTKLRSDGCSVRLVRPAQGLTFDINATPSPVEGGMIGGAGNYDYGATCTLAAIANDGYSFVNWTENGEEVSTDATFSFTVTGNRNLVANFSLNSYSVSITVNPAESGTVVGMGSYEHGTICTLTATANAGYRFVNWTENGELVSNDNLYSFEVTDNRNLVANFEHLNYHWTKPTMSNSMTVTGFLLIDGVQQNTDYLELGAFCGDECRGTALPRIANGMSLYFLSIAGDAEGDFITFRLYDHHQQQELDLYATCGIAFQSDFIYTGMYLYTFVSRVDIAAAADPTEGGVVTGTGGYFPGLEATLTATANTGYSFVNWTLNGTEVSTEASYTFTVTEATSYVAHFSLNSYGVTVTASPSQGGMVSGTGIYNHFETCTLTATAATGYTFQSWTLNGTEVSTDPTYTFEVDGPADYVAHFSLNSYEITATADPTGYGTVMGSGTYDHFASCTLTASSSIGYHFVNWTLDGVVVSTDAEYTFEVVGPANYVAHFSLNNYTVTATANPTVGGTVEGAGTYDQFTTCTLTATANESFQFKNWTVGGTVVSTSPTYTFEVSGPVEAIALFDLVQTTAMSNGWTWWSTCVELTGIDGLTMLENSLGDNGVMIKNSNAYVQNYSAYGLGWMGTENMVLSNEKGYKVNTNAACTATMVGSLANPADHPIEIQPQWNWIGYPVFQTQTVSSALAGFQPTANDIIKGQGDFSNYILGYGWLPEIILEPGKSYLYHSNNTENQTLVFAESKNGTPVVETDNRHWRNDIYAYADNLCLIAVVSINEEEQRTENLELGAFVKGECRGSVRLKYVEPLDRYYAMMTITGESGDEIGFALIDETGNVISSEIGKNFAFINDAIVGSLDNPYRIDFGMMTSVEEHPMACLNVYPNPVNHGTAFNLLIPDDEIITDFVIVNMTGVEVRHERGALTRRTVAGLPTSGVYIVKVVCKSGRVYQSRLIVK